MRTQERDRACKILTTTEKRTVAHSFRENATFMPFDIGNRYRPCNRFMLRRVRNCQRYCYYESITMTANISLLVVLDQLINQ